MDVPIYKNLILLRSTVLIPPTPEDNCWAEDGRVFITYTGTASPTKILIGILNVPEYYPGRHTIAMKSSGNAYEIPISLRSDSLMF